MKKSNGSLTLGSIRLNDPICHISIHTAHWERIGPRIQCDEIILDLQDGLQMPNRQWEDRKWLSFFPLNHSHKIVIVASTMRACHNLKAKTCNIRVLEIYCIVF